MSKVSRVNATLDEDLLARVDEYAGRHREDRSTAILASARAPEGDRRGGWWGHPEPQTKRQPSWGSEHGAA